MLYHILCNESSKLLKIDNIGFSNDPNICRFGPGQRNLYLIHYVISGGGIFNGEYLEKGKGFLITPNMAEHYFPDMKNPWKLLWITSRDPNIKEIFENYNANKKTNIFEYNYIGIADELTKMIEKNHNKVYDASKILEIFLNLFNNQKRKKGNFEKSYDIYYNYALNYIHSNIFRQIKVQELTKILGISQPYLYKIFEEKTSVSPKQYIDNLKITRVKNLLEQTDLQISSIGNSVGFEDQLTFSKFFKSKTGFSPTNYRNSMKKE